MTRLSLMIISILLIIIQYPLWIGNTGWSQVWCLQYNIIQQNRINQSILINNMRLEEKILAFLHEDPYVFEEYARSQLDLMFDNEIFVYIIPKSKNHSN